MADLAVVAGLPPVLARRARHIITENARVLAARSALEREDLVSFGDLLNRSHESLRDDYEVSIPPVDVLVAIARAHPHVLGARMTGGGFGGAIVIAARGGTAAIVARDVSATYTQQTGKAAGVLMPPM
jgi:galactokinase